MKRTIIFLLWGMSVFFITAVALSPQNTEKTEEKFSLKGLEQPVEILQDRWGISHIYAENQKDLFFAQGFNVARDRLFQLEMWRRKATGTLAEILGSKALRSDIGARLFRARVDMKEEARHYHPDGEAIIASFVAGINAYIGHLTEEELPLEFRLLGITPGLWTPEVVVSRHNGLFRNVGDEIRFARLLSVVPEKTVKELMSLHPEGWELKPDESLDLNLLDRKILDIYQASRASIRFLPEDIRNPADRAEVREQAPSIRRIFALFPPVESSLLRGSNNWVVRGNLTETGLPYLANDPHRSQQIPSLRYWVHLHAPGWNVIGGGEPALPGVSIGHNAYGGWGLTIFSIDQEDLYVYDTHPDDPLVYAYGDGWKRMTIFREFFGVKGESQVTADLHYTVHGPVVFEDRENNKAYAVRAAWLEKGCAPYLASLRMDQARSWEEFRQACSYSNTPSENMIWADRNNNIGWQAVGIAPVRRNWDGLLPVPGDGRYEWDGYVPIKDLPHLSNPPEGFFASANEDNIPPGYPFRLGYLWTDPYRKARIDEVLSSRKKFDLQAMARLQQDVLSIPARDLLPLLTGIKTDDAKLKDALRRLLTWDFRMAAQSRAAAIFQAWERRLSQNVWARILPEGLQRIFFRRSLKKMTDFLKKPDARWGSRPSEARDALLLKSLEEALADIEERLGPDWSRWQYGQEKNHHLKIRHSLSRAVNGELQRRLDTLAVPRGGNSFTVNMTTDGLNQSSGASFRIIVDLNDWDRTLGTNTPGQSGNPDSAHYTDLLEMLAEGSYFPVLYTREKIESATEKIIRLLPQNKSPDAE